MRSLTNRKIPKLIVIISFFFFFFGSININIADGAPSYKNIGGNSTSDRIPGNGQLIVYNFPRGNQIGMQSNVSIDLKLSIHPQLLSRNMKFNILSDSPINLTIESGLFSEDFKSGTFQKNRIRYQNRWGISLHIQTNVSIERLEISSEIGDANQVFQDDEWAIYSTDEEWELIDTLNNETDIITTLEIDSMEYFVSIFSPEEDNFVLIIVISLVGIVVLSLAITLSKSEYRQFIKNRLLAEPQQKHRLNIEEVLENENRSKIIDIILENPGIHFNEILRATSLSPGNLVWHLDILESYKVIGKKNVGQYLVYFPYHNTNPMSKIDIKLAKSKVTLKILNLIEENPGNYANNFAKLLNLDHKTIKYHIDKLVEEGLIEIRQSGRKKLLYPVLNNRENKPDNSEL